jgi:hypothetical protein
MNEFEQIEPIISYVLKTVKSVKADFGREFDFKAASVLADSELERMGHELPERAVTSIHIAIAVEMRLAAESFFDPKKTLDAWRELTAHKTMRAPQEKENEEQ